MAAKELAEDDALLITCRALNPFVTFDLLQSVGGEVRPIPGAADVLIGELLITLAAQDDKFGLHTIDSIINTLFAECKREGFSVVVSKSKMVKGKYKSVGSLADQLVNSAEPIEE